MNEQKELSNIIKNVHASLRKSFQHANEEDFKRIWQTHCKNEFILKNYSEAMKNLATNIWDKQRPGGTRIDWVHKTCQEYFFEGGLQKIKAKDIRSKLYHGQVNMRSLDEYVIESPIFDPSNKLKLLDVGSCYDSFYKFPIFESVAIDLYPAEETVIKCDFLNIQINYDASFKKEFNKVKTDLTQLPSDYFHIVVFCLLLEYIPCPKMRLKCCELAQKLLLHDGLLVIVTCDSHKQHRNMDMIMQWKHNIEKLSFQRNKYEKLDHLHCMTFRKLRNSNFFQYDKNIPSNITNFKSNICNNFTVDMPIFKNLSESFQDLPETYKDNLNLSNKIFFVSNDLDRDNKNLSDLETYPKINNNVYTNFNLKKSENLSITNNSKTLNEFTKETKNIVYAKDNSSTMIHTNVLGKDMKNIYNCKDVDTKMTVINILESSIEFENECRPAKSMKIENTVITNSLSNNININRQNNNMKNEIKINSSKKLKCKKVRNYNRDDSLNIPQDFY